MNDLPKVRRQLFLKRFDKEYFTVHFLSNFKKVLDSICPQIISHRTIFKKVIQSN